MADIPIAPGDKEAFVLRGRTFNALRDEAMRSGKLTAVAPLEIRNDDSGATVSLNAVIPSFAFGIVVGPDEDGNEGRTLVKLIDGPILSDATGPFTKADLGVELPNGGPNTRIVEAWGVGVENLAPDTPVWGWHVGNREDAKQGREVLLVASGGALPTPQYQEDYYGGISQNVGGFKPIYASSINTGP